MYFNFLREQLLQISRKLTPLSGKRGPGLHFDIYSTFCRLYGLLKYFSVCGKEVVGIWPQNWRESAINCARVANFSNVIATGDDSGCVKLFKFPCSEKNVICTVYVCLLYHSCYMQIYITYFHFRRLLKSILATRPMFLKFVSLSTIHICCLLVAMIPGEICNVLLQVLCTYCKSSIISSLKRPFSNEPFV